MKMLRTTIKAIVILALLKIIMLVLDRYSPASRIFHRQFLFSVQLLVIAWLVIIFLLIMFKAGKSWVARFLPVLLVMLVLAVDILFSFWMEHPSRIPAFLRKDYKNYYASFERNIIDFEPCSVYDTSYAYKLIPGLSFTFGNIEYNNKYTVNSESLRDDESSMMGPQILCAGNSYTLGIGVEQNQSFPDLLATECNKTVLNTGNSSYGTVREMMRFINSDTSILEYLIIQYSKYDVYENESFLKNNGVLPVITDSVYKRNVTNYGWRKEYFPGKYAMTIGYNFFKSKINRLRKKKYYLSGDAPNSAKYFLQVIDKYKPGRNLKIIVTEINDYNDMYSGFLPAVDSLLNQSEFAHLKNQIKTVDLSDIILRSDYFMIDSHLRSSGHRKIAKRLASYIK